MERTDIEISVSVQIEAGIHFWVDRDEWNSMSDDEKLAAIGEQIDAASIRANNDCFDYPSGTISANIYGPDNDKINLAEIDIYDPVAA